jgi:hypothetical protein
MRRWGLVAVVLALAGCNALRDAFSAHPQVAGTAAGQTLTVTRLADLAGRAKKVPLRPDALTGLATIYLDYAVFAVELARGRNLADSTLVLQANWPNVAQLRWEHYHDRLVAARSSLTGGQTDSAYRAGDVRLFQHILISVPPGSAPKVEQDKKQRAEGLLRQAATQHGANFVQLARRYSEDPGSKSRGGYLGTVGRGRFVPAFDSVAWQLPPGGMSGVVRSPFGFHIIRRPPLEEARDSFRADLETALAARFDSAYVDGLATERNLQVESGAAVLVRQTIQDIAAAVDDTRKLATYRGGTFRVRELARWLYAIDPRDVSGIGAAKDAQLTDFVRHLAQRELLLREVDSAGVRLTPEDWRGLRTQHDSTLKILENLLAMSPQLFKDSAATEPARTELAMTRVNDYMGRVFDEGAAQFFPVPPFLAMALRPGQHWSVNGAGVSEALERAQAVRAQLDSATRRSGTGLKPAPGPAPALPADSAKRKAAP